MANDNINIGIVGLGFMAAMHIRAYHQVEGVTIGAICDLDPERLKGDFTNVLGNIDSGDPVKLDMSQVKAYQDFNELLDDESIDVIDICTPTRTHLLMTKPALASGKHVICEKPLARTVAEAKEIAEAATQAKGHFMVAMCLRFWPQWAWVKEAVDSNAMDLLDFNYLTGAKAVLSGTPDQVVETAKEYEKAGVDLLLCLINPYKIPHEKAMQTIELMGKYVLPEFEAR